MVPSGRAAASVKQSGIPSICPRSNLLIARGAISAVRLELNASRNVESSNRIMAFSKFRLFPRWNSRNSAPLTTLPYEQCSVPGGDRCSITAEAVVDAQGQHVNVLSDPIVDYPCKARIGRDEEVVFGPHPEMVVLNSERPVRGKAILEPDPQGAAPAPHTGRDQTNPASGVKDVEAIVSHSRAALDIEQRRIPRPADLSREEADAVGLYTG